MKIVLTKKQQELEDYILLYTNKHGKEPTLIVLAKHFKKSIPTIQQHRQAIREKRKELSKVADLCTHKWRQYIWPIGIYGSFNFFCEKCLHKCQ